MQHVVKLLVPYLKITFNFENLNMRLVDCDQVEQEELSTYRLYVVASLACTLPCLCVIEYQMLCMCKLLPCLSEWLNGTVLLLDWLDCLGF